MSTIPESPRSKEARDVHPGLRRSLITAAVLAVIAGRSPACGPFFPNQVLVEGDRRVLDMPAGNFADELDRLRPADDSPVKNSTTAAAVEKVVSEGAFANSINYDVAELKFVLLSSNMPAERRDALLAQYLSVRENSAGYTGKRVRHIDDPNFPIEPLTPSPVVPDGLPAEFAHYLQGRIFYDRGKLADARAAWRTLLDLPANQRSHRGAWAAYMIGRSYVTEDPKAAVGWFAKTREMLKDHPDPLELTAESFGWEARAQLNAGRLRESINAYYTQWLAGDVSAVQSLQMVGPTALTTDAKQLAEMAKDPVVRRVLTAYIVCRGGPWNPMSKAQMGMVPRWLTAVETADATDVGGADRIAWAAYSTGDFKAAQRWVDRAPKDSVIGRWVRAKLLLRAGSPDEAATVLSTVVRMFPESMDMTDIADRDQAEPENGESLKIPRQITSDLAVLNLTRGQYTDSLRLLVRADRWFDAAYVAERVLTIEELKQYVDRHEPEPTAELIKADSEAEKTNPLPRGITHQTAIRLRHLLARRLTRAGRWKEARDYYPAGLRATLDQYITAIRDGNDARRSKTDRAISFRTAATIAHDQGMELLGTEVGPDYFCLGGSFEFQPGAGKPRGEHDRATAPSADELARFKASTPDDARRFHYRYVALDHAWNAIQLMPDDTDELAAYLCKTANWVKSNDAKSVDKFYKALVRRCPSTEQGKKAAELHWFPA